MGDERGTRHAMEISFQTGDAVAFAARYALRCDRADEMPTIHTLAIRNNSSPSVQSFALVVHYWPGACHHTRNALEQRIIGLRDGFEWVKLGRCVTFGEMPNRFDAPLVLEVPAPGAPDFIVYQPHNVEARLQPPPPRQETKQL